MPDDTRTPRAERPTKLRAMRPWRLLSFCAAGVAILLLLVVFAAPPLVRPMLEERLSQALNRKVFIGALALHPFALSATLRDVAVAEPGEGPPLLKLDEL